PPPVRTEAQALLNWADDVLHRPGTAEEAAAVLRDAARIRPEPGTGRRPHYDALVAATDRSLTRTDPLGPLGLLEFLTPQARFRRAWLQLHRIAGTPAADQLPSQQRQPDQQQQPDQVLEDGPEAATRRLAE